MGEVDREIGAHAEAIDTLKAEVSALRDDIAEIKEILASSKGSVRTLITVGTVAASIGGAIAWILEWFRHP